MQDKFFGGNHSSMLLWVIDIVLCKIGGKLLMQYLKIDYNNSHNNIQKSSIMKEFV